MKIIMYCWYSSIENIVEHHLKKLNHEVFLCRKPCKDYIKDMELSWEMIQLIQSTKAEAVFSVNYFPIISSICQTVGILYYAWVYDNPHFTLFANQAKLSCNRLYLFDKSMVERLNQLGVEHVYYLPLAVDAAFFSSKIEQSENLQKYKADVSFVGSFYANEQSYYELFNDDTYKNDRLKEPLNQIIKTGCFLYGKPYLEYLTQLLCQEDIWELFDYIEKATNIRLGQGYFSEQSDIILPSVIERKITVEERRLLMTAVAEEHWDFKLYTNSDLVAYPDCLKRANQGIVDYETEMPVVFHESKINLNVSLKSIHTGIPLRVLDIMASGGFVLSNRQTEIEEYFEIGREIAVFDSLSECLEQIRYYLSHDEERQQIAQAGQDKVKRLFRYEYLLGKMF